MTTINFAHVTYDVDRAFTLGECLGKASGCKRIVAVDRDLSQYPKGQEWRARVMFTRFEWGWRYESNNVGSPMENPAQVAMLDAAWDEAAK